MIATNRLDSDPYPGLSSRHRLIVAFLLDLAGYPKREENDETGKEVCALYFVVERIDSALGLIDSALLTIGRN